MRNFNEVPDYEMEAALYFSHYADAIHLEDSGAFEDEHEQNIQLPENHMISGELIERIMTAKSEEALVDLTKNLIEDYKHRVDYVYFRKLLYMEGVVLNDLLKLQRERIQLADEYAELPFK